MPAHTPHTSSAPAPARTPPHPPAPALPHAHPTIGCHRLPRLVIRDAHGAPNAPLPWTLLPSSAVPLPRGPPTRKAELPRVKEAKSAGQACVALPHIVHGNAIVSMMRSDPVPHRPCRTCQPRTMAALASHVFLCLCALLSLSVALFGGTTWCTQRRTRSGRPAPIASAWSSGSLASTSRYMMLAHAPDRTCCAILLARWPSMISWVCERAADMAGVLQVDR